jgi:hypothetical protein
MPCASHGFSKDCDFSSQWSRYLTAEGTSFRDARSDLWFILLEKRRIAQGSFLLRE